MGGGGDVTWCIVGEKKPVEVREASGLEMPAGAMSRLAYTKRGVGAKGIKRVIISE